jgi:hypothetical protein
MPYSFKLEKAPLNKIGGAFCVNSAILVKIIDNRYFICYILSEVILFILVIRVISVIT